MMTSASQCNSRSRRATPTPGGPRSPRATPLGRGVLLFGENHGRVLPASCAARPARCENVAFHPTAEEAERAGFRPCKR